MYWIWVVIVEGEGAVFGMNLWRPIVINVDGDALFPNYFGGGFVVLRKILHEPLRMADWKLLQAGVKC